MFFSVLPLLLTTASLVRADELHFEYEAYNDGQWGTFPNNYYRSINAKTPQLQVNLWKKELMSKGGSHIFIRHDGHTPGAGSHSQDSAPLILNTEDLSAVYVNRSYNAVFNVAVQQDRGVPYLTYYGGPMSGIGLGDGFAHALDSEYREIYHVAAQNLAVKADIHEFAMTGHGTAIVTAYELVPWDLSAFSTSPRAKFGNIKDSVFQEIDLDTNEVLFQWRASEHINMSGSYEQLGNPDWGWDFFHINSIQKSKDGNYLISARHMHSIYMINGETGDVMWTLGGKFNEFAELPYPEGETFGDPLLTMAWQHHAQFYPGSDEKEITFFDNHVLNFNGYGCTRDCSRGVHIRLDYDAPNNNRNKTVQLLHEYRHPVGLQSQSQGSVQVLDNGNVFVGWGRNPAFTEHLPDGTVVFDVQFSPWRSEATNNDGLDNYRAYRYDWIGTPHWNPDIMAERSEDGSVRVWMSWNGATEVAEWVVLGHDSENNIDGARKVVARGPRHGFETDYWFESLDATHVRAAALNAAGDVIGSTGVVDLEKKVLILVDYPVTEVEGGEEEEEQEEQEEQEEPAKENPAKGDRPGKGERPGEAAGQGQAEGTGKGGHEGNKGGEHDSSEDGKDGDKSISSTLVFSYYEYYSGSWGVSGFLLRIGGFGFAVWAFTRFL